MHGLDLLLKFLYALAKQLVMCIAAASAILAGVLSLLVPDMVFGTRIFFPSEAVIPAKFTIMLLGLIGFLILKALIFYKFPKWIIGKEP